MPVVGGYIWYYAMVARARGLLPCLLVSPVWGQGLTSFTSERVFAETKRCPPLSQADCVHHLTQIGLEGKTSSSPLPVPSPPFHSPGPTIPPPSAFPHSGLPGRRVADGSVGCSQPSLSFPPSFALPLSLACLTTACRTAARWRI